MKYSVTILFFCIIQLNSLAQLHPIAFANKAEFQFVKQNIASNEMIKKSFLNLKSKVDAQLGLDIDVPVPKDAAGGYTHDKHKTNYLLMFDASQMYQLTGEKKYAEVVKKMFLKYVALNPTLVNHPQATSSSPGRLFWQALNDANWLVFAGLAFDCIHDYLSLSERKQIADGAFKPLVDYFTKDIKPWFNLIHNHAVWACAGVGIVGIATDNDDYLNMALYGTEKDGKAGFIAHLDGLFATDGYYNEGPYYTRYAVLPFFYFANAIQQVKPSVKIFQHRDSILKKALDVCLNLTNTDGSFYSFNDALKEKTYTSNELVVAVDIASKAYGVDPAYLPVAKAQNRILLNKGGVEISNSLKKNANKNLIFPYKSAQYVDGADGKSGGVTVLRNGAGNDLMSLIFKYSSHGLSHGHYDKLNIQLYDKGNEVLQDYGAVRFINIEHKWGGRYLPETNSYAQQTIAHNTITVDETSHYKGIEKISEQHHGNIFYSDLSGKNVQVVSSYDDQAYSNVKLHRTLFMIQLPDVNQKLVLDIFKTKSDSVHQYDLPFNYLGTLMKTNFKYKSFLTEQKTLGIKNGYQHLWQEAVSDKLPSFTQFTYLNHRTFYTISSLSSDSATAHFTRVGASDPNFNLRHDPSYILRTKSQNQTFINVIESHGNFDPVTEISSNTNSVVSAINKLQDDAMYTVAEVVINKQKLLAIQCNNDNSKTSLHEYFYEGELIKWNGPFLIRYNNKNLK
jgi:hypothetical protein